MNVGLYFGSFNPVHHGHLIIANHILSNTDLKQVWFIVSPQNPLKPSHSLLNEYHRLYLMQLAIENEKGLKVSDIEFRLPRPSYTIDTLTYLHEKYPEYKFSVILGSDSLQNLDKWKNYQAILDNYRLIVYRRPGFDTTQFGNHPNVTILAAPLLEISSTYVRQCLRKNTSIRYLVPENVREEIERNNYYRG